MAVLICGHQRSGTTLLRQICNAHPDIAITLEFGNFLYTGRTFSQYVREILRQWWEARSRPLGADMENRRQLNMPLNLLFVSRFLWGLTPYRHTTIQAMHIEKALKKLYSGKRLVGDKHPDYVFQLDHLVPQQGAQCVVIYRDPRDVASSSLEKARTIWRPYWPEQMQDTRFVAQRWVAGMHLMRRHAKNIHTIRYESLVTEPGPVLQKLGEWLGVDPRGFPQKMIHAESIGKYREGLTDQEVQGVIDVAGRMMVRLGYEV